MSDEREIERLYGMINDARKKPFRSIAATRTLQS